MLSRPYDENNLDKVCSVGFDSSGALQTTWILILEVRFQVGDHGDLVSLLEQLLEYMPEKQGLTSHAWLMSLLDVYIL